MNQRVIHKINKYTLGGYGMNKVNFVGRLVKDPEQRYTTNNTAVCGFTLAVNRRFKQEGQPDADFFPVVAWQKTAEFCGKYFNKGQQVWVSGRLQTRNWEDDKQVKHYVTEIVAEEVGFADSKKDDGANSNSNSNSNTNNPPPQDANAPVWAKEQEHAAAPAGGTFPWQKPAGA
jgi:single-strand DNA-binding protein